MERLVFAVGSRRAEWNLLETAIGRVDEPFQVTLRYTSCLDGDGATLALDSLELVDCEPGERLYPAWTPASIPPWTGLASSSHPTKKWDFPAAQTELFPRSRLQWNNGNPTLPFQPCLVCNMSFIRCMKVEHLHRNIERDKGDVACSL